MKKTDGPRQKSAGGKAGKLICAFFADFFAVVVRDEACEPEKNGQSTYQVDRGGDGRGLHPLLRWYDVAE